MSPAAPQEASKIFFFLKEKEAKRTSRLWLGVCNDRRRPSPQLRLLGKGMMGFAGCGTAEAPPTESFLLLFPSKKRSACCPSRLTSLDLD
jgi:hypothetical protein